MPLPLDPARPITKPWAYVLLVLVAAVGCGKAAAVGHYQVPKEPGALAQPQEQPNGPDRMLAAIVPHNNAAWFFKLAGPADVVAKHEAAFEDLIKSIAFAETEESPPNWKLPEGWKQKEGGADLRFATITISEKPPLEITVTTLPWPQKQELDQLLSNLNRWRGQMSLKPIDTGDLGELRAVKLADGDAIVVDFHGTLKPGGMQPPFAAAAGGGMSQGSDNQGSGGSLPTGHPPVAAQQSPEAAPGKDAPAAPAWDKSELPFSFTIPEGWTASKPPAFAMAAFTVKKDSRQVEITASPLGRGAGGMLLNINRWRAQLKLPEITSDDVNSMVKATQVDGKPAQLVQLVAPDSAKPRNAIVVVVADRDDATWFFRMRGDADLAKDEQQNFEKFVGSIKFREQGK